jgi:hypothetical protein
MHTSTASQQPLKELDLAVDTLDQLSTLPFLSPVLLGVNIPAIHQSTVSISNKIIGDWRQYHLQEDRR